MSKAAARLTIADFKVGDRVRVRTKRFGNDQFNNIGTVHSIQRFEVLPIHVIFGAGQHSDWNVYDPADLTIVENRRSAPKSRPSIAADLNLKPSTKRILSHLRRRGSITPLEAMAAYSTMRIAPAIYDLRRAGYNIATERRRDENGHQYVRYTLKGARKAAA